MGFKTFTVFASKRPGYFGTHPKHNSEWVDATMHQLGLTGYILVAHDVPFQVYPKDKDLYIGVYAEGIAIAQIDLPAAFFDERSRRRSFGRLPDMNDFKQKILDRYAQGEVVALTLHSVVNLWGFSVFKDGNLIRSASGGDGEFLGSSGDPLPEEDAILKTYPIETLDPEHGGGEELVFEVARRVFGKRFDEEDLEDVLRCSHYRMAPKARSTWSKLWTFWRTIADLPGLLFDVIFDAISRSRKIGK
jgi:hypothetical protein